MTAGAASTEVARQTGAPPAPRPARRAWPAPVVFAAYLVVGVWTTWPLARTMTSGFVDAGDPYSSAWNLWWVKESLVHLDNPWCTDRMFAPAGSCLAFHALVPLAGVVMAPLTALLGPALTLNLAKLLVPALACLLTFRVARRLGLGGPASFLAGLLYGYSTMLVWRADFHFNFSVGSLVPPGVLLLAVRLHHLGFRRRDAAALGAALGAGLLVDLTAALFGLAVGVGYLLAVGVGGRALRYRVLAAAVVVVPAALLVAGPQLWMMASQAREGTLASDPRSLAVDWTTYESSVAAMLSPSPSLRVDLPFLDRGRMYRSSWGEAVPAFGVGLLGLAALGLALARRRVVAWLGLLWLGGFLLALGPELTLRTRPRVPLAIERNGQALSAVLPYTWLVQLPGMADLRVASRFSMLALLPGALLAGAGFQQCWRRGWALRGLGTAMAVVAVLESGWAVGDHNVLVPLRRTAFLAPVTDDPTDSIVVDVPIGWMGGTGAVGSDGSAEGRLRATEHGHPVAIGMASRLTPARIDLLRAHRFYLDLMTLQAAGGGAGAAPAPDPAAGRADAEALDVGWVVVWPASRREVAPYLVDAGFALVHESDGVVLYRAPMRR